MKATDTLKWGLVALLGTVFLAEAWLTLDWRMVQDSPLLHYVAFTIDKHGYAPYRDIFETSMPGTFIFHLLIVNTVGYGDLAFRLVDLSLLAATMWLIWLILKPFGKPAAWAAAFGMAIVYLGYGPAMSLQRDFFGFVPVLAAIWLATLQYRAPRYGALTIGLMFGLASIVKPHLAIGFPAVMGFFAANREHPEYTTGKYLTNLIRWSTVAAIGIGLVVGLTIIWLWQTGGFPAFWEMLTRYLPLHVDMTGNITTVTPEEKRAYIARMLSRDLRLWLPPALLGLSIGWVCGRNELALRRIALMLGGMLLCYAIYPVLAAQFWAYHWLPFRVIAILCAALMLAPLANFRGAPLAETGLTAFFAFSILVWGAFVTLQPLRFKAPWGFAAQISGAPAPAPKNGRVDEIASFLQSAELGSEDRVHPLDWTEGALHAMLISEALIATPFIYDYHFYHYVSNPFIQEIRRRHVAELENNPPRFLIDIDDQLKPSGIDTTDSFPAIEKFIADNYRVALVGDNYRVLEYKK